MYARRFHLTYIVGPSANSPTKNQQMTCNEDAKLVSPTPSCSRLTFRLFHWICLRDRNVIVMLLFSPVCAAETRCGQHRSQPLFYPHAPHIIVPISSVSLEQNIGPSGMKMKKKSLVSGMIQRTVYCRSRVCVCVCVCVWREFCLSDEKYSHT
jgi:hypothetical protein